jgi:hypothetical protein
MVTYMAEPIWRYPEALRAALEEHGVSPTDVTSPRLVRGYLNDLYRFEIRRLKERHLAGHVSKADYVPQVIVLRKKYVALSLTPEEWERAVSPAVPAPNASQY